MRVERDKVVSAEGNFQLLVGSVTDYAVCLLDPAGRVTSWNTAAQRISGYEAREVVGVHISHFYTEEDRAAGVPEAALRTAETEGRYESEAWRVRKDGSHFWAHVVVDPVRDVDGKLVNFVRITRDLTERRAAEDALRLSEERFR